MPTLNSRIQATGKNEKGQHVTLPPGKGLQQLGPRVQVTLSPLASQAKFFTQNGATLPSPVVGLGLIDTGASSTCFDQDTAAKAALAIVDSGPMTSATHANEIVPIFAGRMTIQGLPVSIDATRAYGANLAPQGLVALIGRDILASCVLIYNGSDDSFSLSI